MYYDPMISKLIAWGENRPAAMNLLGKAMDEYIIKGVTHNIGFGRSILRNPDFSSGSYSTAFIPKYYPKGFHGDPISSDDKNTILLSSMYVRNLIN